MNIDLLDVGVAAYGDSILCRFDDTTVMIDGAHPGTQNPSGIHPSIPAQLGQLLGSGPPFELDLLVVSHAHMDHIGCLPNLVTNDVIHARWAIVADPDLGWGILAGAAPQPDDLAASMVTRLREEPIEDATDDVSVELLSDSVGLEEQYRTMLDDLTAAGTTVVRYGNDDTEALLSAFEPIGLSILGPTTNQLQICATAIAGGTTAIADALTPLLAAGPEAVAGDAMSTETDLYRRIMTPVAMAAAADVADALTEAASASRHVGAAINLQSMVLLTQTSSGKFLFGGDMQFADPGVSADGLQEEVDALRSEIAKNAPFDFAKLSHHGSSNAFDQSVMEQWAGTKYFGICAGEKSVADPTQAVLDLLASQGSITWARTDHNGLSTFTFDADGRAATVSVARGATNDARSNATP
jgi:beta-lactamase superfamily II metal-dependent hydrolase